MPNTYKLRIRTIRLMLDEGQRFTETVGERDARNQLIPSHAAWLADFRKWLELQESTLKDLDRIYKQYKASSEPSFFKRGLDSGFSEKAGKVCQDIQQYLQEVAQLSPSLPDWHRDMLHDFYQRLESAWKGDEQSVRRVLRERDMHKVLEKYLATIKKEAPPIPQEMDAIFKTSPPARSPTCFISYSWGVHDQERRVHQLAEDLKLAGIDIRLDIIHNKHGDIGLFLDYLDLDARPITKKTDFVLVIGTPDLKEKWDNRSTGGASRGDSWREYRSNVLPQELSRIEGRLASEPSARQTIFPIILSGNSHTSLPGFLSRLATSALDMSSPGGYYQAFFELLEILYRDCPNVLQVLSEAKKAFTRERTNINQRSCEAVECSRAASSVPVPVPVSPECEPSSATPEAHLPLRQ